MKLKDNHAHKRVLSTLAISAAAALLLAGCSPSSTADEDGSTELVLANSQWLDQNRGDGLWAAVKKYEEAADGVTLEQEAIPSGEISTKLTTELGAGVGPDVMFIQSDLLNRFAEAGFLADIESTIDGVDLNVTNEAGVIDGERFGVAWQRAPFALLYNQALLDEAGVASVPTTPEELIAAAKKVEDATDAVGFGEQSVEAGLVDWTYSIHHWVYGAGGAWSDGKGNLTIDTPENVAGFETIVKLAKSKIMNDDDFQTQRPKFGQGFVAMMTDIAGGAQIAADTGVVDPLDIKAVPIPMPFPGMHQQMFIAVNKKSENLDAALDFVKWLVNPEGQEALRLASGADALATDVPLDSEFAAANPWAESYLEIGSSTKSVLIEGFESETGPIIQVVVKHLQDAVINGTSPKKALAAAQAEAEALG